MSTKYNKIKSNALNKAKKVRTEQAQAKAKKYNREVGKADIAYINGDLRKASSMRAYGIKKQRAEGNQIYGYDNLYNARDNQVTVGREKNKAKAEYLYTNKESVVEGGTREDGSKYDSFVTKKRRLSDTEKENFAKYGDTYDKDADKKKYKLFNSANKDADSYLEHFNTGQWDGLKTAKARIKDQDKKGISKLVEYGIGLGKDILADPVVDAMRVADAVGGAMTGAGLGALENMENALKGHKMEEGLIRKNFKDSLSTSNKTGWSKGSSEFLTEKDIRQFEKDREYFKNDAMLEKIYGTSDLEEFKDKAQKGNNWAGLIWDVIGDPTGLVTNFGKNATKATVKAGKEMLDGTADISTGIKSKHLDDIFFSSKPYEDLKLYDDSGANKIHNQLDNGYNRAVSNDVKVKVKEKVSTSSYTPFLASYLDELDNNKPLAGKQLKMDGRTLNKKWTQTKAPIEPYKIQEVDPVIKGAKVDTGRQMTMFGKDGDISKGYLNSINNPNGRINKILDSYDGTNVDEFIDKLDNLDDATYDRVMDLARVKHPELYNKLVEGSDEITDAIEGTARRKDYVPQSQARADKKYFGTQSLRKMSDIPEANGKSLLENYNEFNKSRIGKTTKKITPRSSVQQTSLSFEKGVNSWADKVSGIVDEKTLTKISNGLNGIKNTDFPTYKKVTMLNQYLFGGKEVIRTNLPQRNIDQILDYMIESVDSKLQNKAKEIKSKGKFFGRSSTDIQFEQKMSDIASYMGVANKSVFTKPYNELEEIKKTRPLTTDEFYKYKELGDKIAEWNKLYADVANMGDEYTEYAQKKYGKENPLDGFNKVVQEQADMKRTEKLNAHDIEQEVLDELKELDVKDITQDEIDELVNARTKEYYDEMNKYNAKDPHKKSKTEPLKPKEVEEKTLRTQVSALRKELNLPEVKAPNVKVKLTKGQKLRDLPPVKESLKNLRSVIEKEVNYMYNYPQNYSSVEKAFKQIKTDYVNTLRQMGVPDDKYFHKVKALQDELKAIFEKGTKSNSPLVKMNLQHLARRISETFDEIDNTVLDNIDEYVNDFEKLNAEENLREIEKLKNSNKGVKQIETVQKPTLDEIDEILKEHSDLTVPKFNSPEELLANGKYDEDGVLKGSFKPNTPINKVAEKIMPNKDISKEISKLKKEKKTPSFQKFKSWLNDDELMAYQKNDLYGVYKSWLNSYKKGLTVYNPGWHVQNYFQNKGQNYLALGMDAFKPQTNAKQIIKEIKGKPNKAKNVGKYTPQQIAKMAEEMGVVDGLGTDVQQARGIFPRLENQIDNTPMMKKLMENEKTARLHHFITQLENGMTPEKALKSVNDTLFDYSKANKVDKFVSDFIDPFWTFHKNNATLMGKSAFSPNSGRLNKVRKFHENLDDTQEKEVKQNYGRLYGNKSFVDDVNGDTYNYLYKEGMMPDIANALPLSQEEVENKLNPILRLLAQQSRGEGNFGNKIVEGNEAGWGEVTKDERVGEVIQELNPFMPGLVKTLVKNHNTQKKTDDEKQSQSTTDKQIFYDWLSYITGFKGNYYREIK